jgi:hypothetical protein
METETGGLRGSHSDVRRIEMTVKSGALARALSEMGGQLTCATGDASRLSDDWQRWCSQDQLGRIRSPEEVSPSALYHGVVCDE